MEYYKTNALYEYLKSNSYSHFRFVSGNAWQLVYGNANCDPILLVFIVGVDTDQLDNERSDFEKETFNLSEMVSKRAKIPNLFIRFASDVDEVESVRVLNDESVFYAISMTQLSDLFKNMGLSISNTKTAKYLNDKTSSAYHKWQRGSLGSSITVSDIDLWKVDEKGNPQTIFELKRSFIDLVKWSPYPDDYRNFKLLSNLCRLAGLDFKIVYNQRLKEPFVDKIDQLQIFDVDFSRQPPISQGRIIDLEQLISI